MYTNNRNTCRLGRRPVKQGPRPLLSDQGRVEKLVTGSRPLLDDQGRVEKLATGSRPLLGDQGRIEKLATGKSTSTKAAEKLKIAKNALTVGTWNVQTLWATGKLELLRNEMKRFRYDIVGISEVRWTGKGETSNRDFIWSGEDKTHVRGVGMLLSDKARKALIGYNPVSSRVITARFDSAPYKITVIHAYAPTAASSDEDIEAFYSILEDALAKVHKKDIIIITGDWNAKIGSDNTDWKSVIGRYGYGDRNERGERLLEFAATHSLYICNTRFEQKSQRKWTWASPDGVHKNMIDLILIQQRWKSSVINCRTFQSADICSDHSLVLCNIRLRLKRLYNKIQYRIRIDVSHLKSEKIRECYSKKLANDIAKIDLAENLEEHAKKIEAAIKKAAEATIPASRSTKKPWISEDTLKLADEKRTLKQSKNASAQKEQQYKDFCKKVKKSARQDKERWIQQQCEEIEKGLVIGKTRHVYSLIKMLRRKFTPRISVIQDQDGKILQSQDEIIQQWTKYCSSLYKDHGGGDSMARDLEMIAPTSIEEPQNILYSEVEEAIRTLKRNKSPGSDGITAEMIQAGGEQLVRQIHLLCNKAWNESTIPEEWSKSILVPVPKKGDLSQCANYRTISLINHTGKILLIILLNRLKHQLEPHLSEEQAGFRKDRSTVHQILTLRLIAEKAKRHGKKIYNCFIDFQKAFDTIKQKVIWATLRSYGIEEKMVTLLQKIYEKAQSTVRIGKHQGEWFHTDLGTRQGDPLSPLLFITYLERIMDHVKESNCGIRLGGMLINNLRFADDIDLIDEDYKSLQEQLEKTRAVAEQAGLIVNVGKTKTMVFGDRKIEQEIRVGRKNVENVDKFEYLWSLITWDNNCSEEIRRRIGKAAGTMASLRHVWNGKKLTIQNKIRILTTCVFSVLLYASETWTLKETDKKKLLAFEMKCYRRILRISWKDMMKNEDIRKTIAREETIIDTIKKRKLRLFGHIRM